MTRPLGFCKKKGLHFRVHLLNRLVFWGRKLSELYKLNARNRFHVGVKGGIRVLITRLFSDTSVLNVFSLSAILCLPSKGKRHRGGTSEEVAEDEEGGGGGKGSLKGRCQISRLFHAADFISQGGYVCFVIAKLWCTSRLSPEASRTVAVRLSG